MDVTNVLLALVLVQLAVLGMVVSRFGHVLVSILNELESESTTGIIL